MVPFHRTLSVVLTTVIGLVPCAPPEHLHETEDANGHHESVTHRHAESHLRHHAPSNHDRSQITLNDEESVVATLDPVFTVADSYTQSAPALEVVSLLDEPVVRPHVLLPQYVERLIHGPPRAPTAPRPPPATPFL